MWADIISFSREGALYLVSFVLATIGLGGCVLPYAGHFAILGAGIAYAMAKGDPYPGWQLWASLTLLAIFGTFVDNIATAIGAKKFGGGRSAFWFCMLGLVIGSLAFFPLGVIIGPFTGAFLAEWLIAGSEPKAAAKAGLGAALGLLTGIGCKLLIAFIMIALIVMSY